MKGQDHMIWYDTRCYFNLRSKADTSQRNLPHGTKKWQKSWDKEQLKSKKKRIFSEISVTAGRAGESVQSVMVKYQRLLSQHEKKLSLKRDGKVVKLRQRW